MEWRQAGVYVTHWSLNFVWFNYGKCPKILYIKVVDKMAYANSADPDQTAPEGAV